MHACSGTSAASDSLRGSCVHGIFPARILEWVAMPPSRRWSWPRDWTWSPVPPALQVSTLLLSHWGSPKCHYTFVQTQRKYNIKSEPESKLWTLGDYDISVHLSLAKKKKKTLWWVILIMEYALHVWGQGYMGNFCTALPIWFQNLKQTNKKKWTLQLSSLKTFKSFHFSIIDMHKM